MLIFGGPILVFLLGMVYALTARAASGLPTSPEFGYGAWIDPQGLVVEQAVETASQLRLDWIAVEFDWAALWPDLHTPPDLNAHIALFNLAAQHNLPVMLSISHPPAWAMTPTGPEPSQTAHLIAQLVEIFPNVLAVEVLPGANTLEGWGTTPNPQAYAQLFMTVTQTLSASQTNVHLLAAGLTPVIPDANHMDELVFLDQLYAAGLAPYMTILSINFPHLTGEVLTIPTPTQPQVLRRFESVRQVMLKNGHQEGMVWVSRFGWPSGTINATDAQMSPETQMLWLHEAYQMLNAQLYIGAALFQAINPPSNPDAQTPSLLNPNGSPHPFLDKLSRLIALQNRGGSFPSPSKLVKLISSNKYILRP